MIHEILTEENLQKAVYHYAIEECGLDTTGWTKAEIKERYIEIYNDNIEDVLRYAYENGYYIFIDDEKDIKEQLKNLKMTQMELIKFLLAERETLLD